MLSDFSFKYNFPLPLQYPQLSIRNNSSVLRGQGIISEISLELSQGIISYISFNTLGVLKCN